MWKQPNWFNDHQTTVLSSSECAVPLVDSQKLLVDLATKIVDSASVIEVRNILKKKKLSWLWLHPGDSSSCSKHQGWVGPSGTQPQWSQAASTFGTLSWVPRPCRGRWLLIVTFQVDNPCYNLSLGFLPWIPCSSSNLALFFSHYLAPFLFVRIQIAGCPDTSTNLLMTMTGMRWAVLIRWLWGVDLVELEQRSMNVDDNDWNDIVELIH